jgi:hypothetical protein
MALRAALAYPALNASLEDPDRYLPLSQTLARGEGLKHDGKPTAYRPPLYPLLLAPLVRVLPAARLGWGIATFHVVLGGLTVWFCLSTARAWGYTGWRYALTGIWVGFDPVLIAQVRSVMTETLAACLAACVLWTAVRLSRSAARQSICWPLGCGIAGGLAVLCRPSSAPGFLLFLPALCTRERRWALGPCLLGFLLTLAPWALRNQWALGAPIWTTTHGGYTLALANNDAYYDDVVLGPPGAVWGGPRQQRWFESITDQTRTLGEPGADRWLRGQAIHTMRQRPAVFVRATWQRMLRFWGLAPSGAVYPDRVRWLCAIWTLPLWLCLAAALLHPRAWRWPAWTATAQIVGLTLVHAAFWTDLRMRAPLAPAIALLASSVLATPSLRHWRPSHPIQPSDHGSIPS